MRLTCPYSGERDSREFSIRGAALTVPPEGEWSEAWDDYLHQRENPAGESREFWYHEPTGTWLIVTRNTVSHEVLSVEPARGSG